MADEMEQIEARLAAYIDGMLPPAQRAEIEAYLAANPTHAKLITELQSIKSAVSSLPKEKAPAEVLDTLQAHLERHTLLEDVEESGDSMRINRWPQMGAVAAVLLLAAGLGLLVYQVLPKHKGPPGDLALLTPSSQDDTSGLGGVGGGAGGDVSLKDADDSARNRRKDYFAADKEKEADKASDTAANPGNANALARAQADRQIAAVGQLQQSNGVSMNDSQFGTAQHSLDQQATLNGPMVTNGSPTNAPQLQAMLAGSQSGAASTAPTMALSDPLRVLIVRSDEPTLTQNLLVASLAQAGISFEFVSPTPINGQSATSEPATQPVRTVAGLAEKLLADHQLTLVEFASYASPARPIVLRGVTAETALATVRDISQRQPTRQTVRWAYATNTTAGATTQSHQLAGAEVSKAMPATTQSNDAVLDQTANARFNESAVPLTTADSIARRDGATTLPNADLVILIVPSPSAPPTAVGTTLPAVSPPSTSAAISPKAATAPSTAPAPLEQTP